MMTITGIIPYSARSGFQFIKTRLQTSVPNAPCHAINNKHHLQTHKILNFHFCCALYNFLMTRSPPTKKLKTAAKMGVSRNNNSHWIYTYILHLSIPDSNSLTTNCLRTRYFQSFQSFQLIVLKQKLINNPKPVINPSYNNKCLSQDFKKFEEGDFVE